MPETTEVQPILAAPETAPAPLEAPTDPTAAQEPTAPESPVTPAAAPTPESTPVTVAVTVDLAAQRLADLIAERDALKTENENLRQLVNDGAVFLVRAGNDIEQLRRLLDQKKRALRYVAAAGRVNATYLALAKFESANQKAAAVIDVPDLHWSDANTLAYLRKAWPLLTPDEQEEHAVRLLNEIVANQRNNDWFILPRALQRASDSKAVQA